MDLRTRLNALKDERKLTNQQISDGSGVPLGSVSGIFSGQTTRPAFEDVVSILDFFGVSVDDFLGRSHAQSSPSSTEPPPVQQPVHFSFQPLRDDVREIAREAICRVYESEAYKNIEKNVKSWKALALAETAFIILVLLWDITHPTMGFIQYSVTTDPVTQGLIDWIRRA